VAANRGCTVTKWQSTELLPVAEHYEIRDGFLLERDGPYGGRTRLYNPFEFPELPGRLAETAHGDETSALEFAHKWGVLGYKELKEHSRFRADDVFYGDVMESGETLVGDPLGWIWDHVRAARMALNLVRLLNEGRPDKTEDYLKSISDDGELMYVAGVEFQGRPFGFGSFDVPLRRARWFLMHILNENMGDYLSPQYAPGPNETLVRSHSAPALLPVIYAHIGDAAEGKLGYYQCARRDCDKWSHTYRESRGPKRRFCPPEQGESDSLCARMERYYKSREPKETGT